MILRSRIRIILLETEPEPDAAVACFLYIQYTVLCTYNCLNLTKAEEKILKSQLLLI
jgi:hypothetical protein